MDFEIFVHTNGRDPAVVKVTDDTVLASVLEDLGLTGKGDDDLIAFVGEFEDDAGDEDAHEPVDRNRKIGELKLHQHRHVHVTRCKRVAVEVSYMGKTKHRKVSPAKTVGALTRWARKVFPLDPAAASEFVLQISGTDRQPRPGVHVGELTTAPVCAVSFDLVKEVTPQG
jgi:hypothetical protein